MINKLEERKLKRETKYKVYSFLGLLLLSIFLTVLVIVSNQTSSKDYPLTYKVLGEKENTVFQDSDLELLDISYPITDVKLYGKDSQLKDVKEVALLIDLRTIDYESLSKPDIDSLEEEEGEEYESNSEYNKEDKDNKEGSKETNVGTGEGDTEGKGYEDVEVEVTAPINVYDYRNGELSLKQSHYESTVNLKVRIYKEDVETEQEVEDEESNKDKEGKNKE